MCVFVCLPVNIRHGYGTLMKLYSYIYLYLYRYKIGY